MRAFSQTRSVPIIARFSLSNVRIEAQPNNLQMEDATLYRRRDNDGGLCLFTIWARSVYGLAENLEKLIVVQLDGIAFHAAGFFRFLHDKRKTIF